MDDTVAFEKAGKVERLKKRRDFLAVKKGARSNGRAFALQAGKSANGGSAKIARFGITVTKKVGNAVIRNRIRRRLRETIRLHAQGRASAGFDYVLVARRAALDAPFDTLAAEFSTGLARVGQKRTFKKR